MERRHLNRLSLVELLKNEYGRIKDQLNGQKFSIVECLCSGLALFGIKIPSLLQFDHLGRDERNPVAHNIRKLYSVDNVPRDTYFRERLDDVDEVFRLQYGIDKIIAKLQSGKVLAPYKFMDGYLVGIDGTGYFSSHEVHCVNCCEKHHRNGSITYHHNILSAVLMHPNLKPVFPLRIESIQKHDGKAKNDSEENACKRLLEHLKVAHPKLKLIIVLDGLYATAPIVKLITKLGWHYIIVAKDVDYLMMRFNASVKKQEIRYATIPASSPKTPAHEVHYEYFYQSDLPLNKSNQDVMVNILDYKETHLSKSKKRNKNYHNTWITDIALTKDSINFVVAGGRSRWHLENETFNTLKNQGYHFEHNFGHGYKNLSTIMAYLMFSAFLIDQVQEVTSKAFKQILVKLKRKLYLWDRFRSLFSTIFFESWEQFFALAENKDGQYNQALAFAAIVNFINNNGPPEVEG